MSFDTAILLAESEIYNKTLNTKFWFNEEFSKTIREKLLNIAFDFIESSKVDPELITDIQLTGSLANYNYTKYSDLDVHILLDFTLINDDKALVKSALDGKRFIWNLRHDIIIRDHEVELYFQDDNEPHIASGLFSILKNEWLITPVYDPPNVDMSDVDRKAGSIRDHIEKLEHEVSINNDPNDAKQLHEYGVKLKRKISNMRQSGLERDGEFAIENLAFKALRNDESIGTLIDTISKAYSQIYSESVTGDAPDTSTFARFFNAGDINKKGPRQQKWGTGLGRQHQNFVPDMHKADGSLNSKIEQLRERERGKLVLSQADVNYCKDKYNIDTDTELTRDEPKQLGTTGIRLYFDPKLNVFVIEK